MCTRTGNRRREMHPVERALDIGQAVGELAVFGKDAEADALHVAFEPAVGVPHDIDVDMRADGDGLELGLAVVGDDVPVRAYRSG